MAQLAPALRSGHISGAMASHLGRQLLAGGAIVYVVMRWGLPPPANPMMGLVPQTAFFLAHLLFGLVIGIVLAMAFRRPGLRGALPASG